MSDRDGLRRRAEVLQRVADQLSAQLRVERWSNGELRKLLGEPIAEPGYDDERAAARRFVTFASVAIVTAAAVALLASSPWHGRDTLPTGHPAVATATPFVVSSAGSTIIPFTVVVGGVDSPAYDKPVRGATYPGGRLDSYSSQMIFGSPGATCPPARRNGQGYDEDYIFCRPTARSTADVP